MPIYQLNNSNNLFPPVEHAEDGIVAVGGDLSPERLVAAYSSGIFPWFSEEDPIVWWAPDPRCMLYPKKVRISKSMKQLLKKSTFRVSFDTAFKEVIMACSAQKREGQGGTWITDDMTKAYINLHEVGLAHSVEVWSTMKGGEQLVGGLYGVSLGTAFFGESMFHKVSNASKYGFITLVEQLVKRDFKLIDCQMETPHLLSFGAELIPRKEFMELLNECLEKKTFQGAWTHWLEES